MASSAYEATAAQVNDLVDRATDETLTAADWQVNITLCDVANANPNMSDTIVKAVLNKIQGSSSKSVLFSMTLIETLVKNGPESIHTAVGSRQFLNEIAALIDGSMGIDVQNKALELIKQWAEGFSGSGISSFQDIYRQLKMRGVVFPDTSGDAPIFTPPTSAPNANATHSPRRRVGEGESQPAPRKQLTTQQQLDKLHEDLKVVLKKVELYKDLRSSGGNSEQLEDAQDFLRQCLPRMKVLIEGGLAGKIDERTLEECLNVNDQLTRVLDAPTDDLMSFESPLFHEPMNELSGQMAQTSLSSASHRNDVDDAVMQSLNRFF